MSAIIFLPGRPTSDPQIMQAKNSNTTYTTLDISCPQRGADGNKETVFYSCYFNSFLADRLIKAGVKKSTGLIIIGELELHPFIHQKGKNQGKPNSGPSVVVKDWQFAPMTYDDANGANPGVPGGVPQNGYGQPGGAPVPNQQGGYPTPAQGGYPQASGAPAGNYAPAGAAPQNRMDMRREDREEQMLLVATYHRTVTASPRTATLRILEAHRITHRAIRTSSLPAAMLLETGQLREHRAAIREMDLPRLQNSRQRHFPLSLDADAQKIS